MEPIKRPNLPAVLHVDADFRLDDSQWAVKPPSTGRPTPITKLAPGLHSHSTAAATSSARKPEKAKRSTIAIATTVGIAINFSSLNPIKALYWSAVINGVVAVPVMIAMMDMTSNPKIMGRFRIHDGLRFMGWITTAVMAVAAYAAYETRAGVRVRSSHLSTRTTST
jgi:Natural resistance-associated macrophage protein-like